MAWTFYNASGEALTNFGPTVLTDIDVANGSDVGAPLVDADEILIYDTSASANKKSDMSRIVTYVGADTDTRSGVAKAWGSFTNDGSDQGTDYNIDSGTQASTGNYVATWTTDFGDAHYSSHVNAEDSQYIARAGVPATGTQAVNIRNAAGAAVDSAWNITAHGTQ